MGPNLHKCLSDKKTTKTRPTLKLLASQHNRSGSLGCGVAGRADEWSPLGGSVPLKYYFQLLSCLLTSLSLRQFPFLLSSEHLHTESQKISPKKSQLSQCFTGVRLKRRDQGELCSWNTGANLETHTHTQLEMGRSREGDRNGWVCQEEQETMTDRRRNKQWGTLLVICLHLLSSWS